MRKYICEAAYESPIEVTGNDDHVLKFTCVLQAANRPNRNGRIYPKEAIDTALQSPIIKEKLRTRTWFMEVGHPDTTDLNRQRTPKLQNCCAIILDYWWDGDLLKAHCETMANQMGTDMMNLIKYNHCQLSFSMRGTGELTRDERTGAQIVGKGLQITTYDWVWLPSHPEAYMEELHESTFNFMFNTTSAAPRQALQESMNLFENGMVVDLEGETPHMTNYDYSAKYNEKYKKLNEKYEFNPEDKIVNVSANRLTMELLNESQLANKKVTVEDYVVKNIKFSFANILKEADEKAVEDKESKDEKKCPECDKEKCECKKDREKDDGTSAKVEEKPLGIPDPSTSDNLEPTEGDMESDI